MKSICILLLCITTALGAPAKPFNLDQDLLDFLALIPVEEVLAICNDYLENDAEVKELVDWVQFSDEAKSLVIQVEALPEFIDFVNFLQDAGLHAYEALNVLHQFMGLPPLVPPTSHLTKHNHNLHRRDLGVRRGTGLNGLMDDIIAILPLEELHNLFLYKEANSPDFQEMLRRIRSPEFQGMIKKLYDIPEFTAALDKLREKGFDVDKYIEFLRKLFGVDGLVKNFNLDQDLLDFLALIPVDEVLAIANDYLENDAEVKEWVDWVQFSDEAKSLVIQVEALPEFIDFVNFLQDAGLHAYEALNVLHQIMGLPPLVPPTSLLAKHHFNIHRRHLGVRRGTGLNGFMDDIIAILPLEELHNLFLYKEANSPDFQEMLRRIRSPEFQGMIKKLYDIPEFTAALDKLREKGFDVDKYIEFLRKLFGVDGLVKNFNLDQDLLDFLALIPVDEVLAIANDYLENDAEVKEWVDWVQFSDEAKSLVIQVEALPEFIDFVNFLQDAGLHAYEALNVLHQIMGLPPLVPPTSLLAKHHFNIHRRHLGVRRGTGLNGFMDDIIAILPLEELHNLFLYKEANSPDFQEMLRRIRSPEFQGMIKKLYDIPEFTAALDKLREKGFDVDKYIEFLRKLFGVDG